MASSTFNTFADHIKFSPYSDDVIYYYSTSHNHTVADLCTITGAYSCKNILNVNKNILKVTKKIPHPKLDFNPITNKGVFHDGLEIYTINDKFDNIPFDKYENDPINSIDVRKDYTYVVSGGDGKHGDLIIYDNTGNRVYTDRYTAGSPNDVSFDDKGNGFVISRQRSYSVNGDSGSLHKYINNVYVGNIHEFDNQPVGVSYTGNAVYVLISSYSTSLHNGERSLKKCTLDGSCSTIDKFVDRPISVTFSSQTLGLGFVTMETGKIWKYENDTLTGVMSPL